MLIGTNFRNVEFLYYYIKKFKKYNFFYASPVELAEKILNNEVTIAPISSVFLALYPKKFLFLPEFSISGKSRTGSILVFSKRYNSLDEVNKVINVGIPENSATSVNLLKVVLNLKKIKANFSNFKNFKESLENNDLVLMIGDDALFSNENSIFDVGEEYYKITNSGVVYALWAINKEVDKSQKEEIRNFFYDLKISREYAYKNFDFVTEEILKDINKNTEENLRKLRENILSLDYNFDDEKIFWLKEFFMLMKKIKIIDEIPELEFFDM